MSEHRDAKTREHAQRAFDTREIMDGTGDASTSRSLTATCLEVPMVSDSSERAVVVNEPLPNPEKCFACGTRLSDYFSDSRTGYHFCAECTSCLISWEMDGCPTPAVDWMYEAMEREVPDE